MKDLLRKIMENADNPENVDLSEQGIRAAAKALGIDDAEIEEAFVGFEGFPLDDDNLEAVMGGFGVVVPALRLQQWSPHKEYGTTAADRPDFDRRQTQMH
ncbi:MAG: hypothetical protein RR009_09050 [Oscillospiraceae bacterium]